MLIGGFGFLKDYEKICDAGYDYAELDMPELEELDTKEFEKVKQQILEKKFPVYVGARLLPISTPLFFTPFYEREKIRKYLVKTCRRISEVGAEKIVVGNGKARWLVDGQSLAKEYIFIDFMKMLCDIAGESNLEVIIEPLGPKYSNYINTIPEATDLITKVQRDNLFTMADLRHLVWSEESLDDIVQYRDLVHHIHLDYPLSYPERKYPTVEDDYDYTDFFNKLKEYKYGLTVEADIPESWNLAEKQVRNLIRFYLDSPKTCFTVE